MTEFAKLFFREVRLEDKETIASSIPPSPLLSCEYCFTNLFSWRKVCGTRWGLFKNRLTAIFEDEDEIIIPAGLEPEPEELHDFFIKIFPDGEGVIARVPNSYVDKFPALSHYFDLEKSRDQIEYVHKTENLVNLKGGAFHKKKNLLSQFLRNNPGFKVEKLDNKHVEECFYLAEKWCETKTCDTFGISHEQSAIKETLGNFHKLGVEGIVLFCENKLSAFSVFTIFNGTCVVHFEKYDREIKGSAQAVNWETAKAVLGRCDYINREQDMGIEGLRKAKMSYNPDIFEADYILSGK